MIGRGSEALVPSLGMGVERQEGAGAGRPGQEREGRADAGRPLTPAAASLARGDKHRAVAARCSGWNHKGFPSRQSWGQEEEAEAGLGHPRVRRDAERLSMAGREGRKEGRKASSWVLTLRSSASSHSGDSSLCLSSRL